MLVRLSRAVSVPLVLLLWSCGTQPQAAREQAAVPSRTKPAAPAPTARSESPVRDLAIDESMGGHTLARHVGKSDAELAERLRREPGISAASTYTDRAIAERVVGATIARGGTRLVAWERRSGRRPNLVLNYVEPARQPIGRTLRRGQRSAQPASRAIVVLRWLERASRFHVLTSYPENE
jgi:hypothetical protein